MSINKESDHIKGESDHIKRGIRPHKKGNPTTYEL